MLSGRRIVITRARSQAGELAQRIEELGGAVVEFPTIEIQPPKSYEPLDTAIREIERYDWIIFTSVNGVERFLQRVAKLETSLRGVTARQIAAIGPKTADTLAKAGLNPAIVPEQYVAEGMLKIFQPESMRDKRVLIPRAANAREVLPQNLREWGATVDVVETYRTTMPNTDVSCLRELIRQEKIDMITFTSPSTVTNFVRLLRLESFSDLPETVKLACIGPITQGKLEKLGGRATVVAEEFTIPGLVRAMENYFAGQAGATTKDRE